MKNTLQMMRKKILGIFTISIVKIPFVFLCLLSVLNYAQIHVNGNAKFFMGSESYVYTSGEILVNHLIENENQKIEQIFLAEGAVIKNDDKETHLHIVKSTKKNNKDKEVIKTTTSLIAKKEPVEKVENKDYSTNQPKLQVKFSSSHSDAHFYAANSTEITATIPVNQQNKYSASYSIGFFIFKPSYSYRIEYFNYTDGIVFNTYVSTFSVRPPPILFS